VRLWNYYLCYCEAGFEKQVVGVFALFPCVIVECCRGYFSGSDSSLVLLLTRLGPFISTSSCKTRLGCNPLFPVAFLFLLQILNLQLLTFSRTGNRNLLARQLVKA
jgi:hypothetical protein